MANEKNLIPQAHVLTVEEQSKGGIASGAARREKKTIQKILSDYLENEVQSVQGLLEIAKTAGVSGEQSIKELATAVCLINTLQKGDVDKLATLMSLLGEKVEQEDTNKDVEETLAIIRECAYADRNKP